MHYKLTGYAGLQMRVEQYEEDDRNRSRNDLLAVKYTHMLAVYLIHLQIECQVITFFFIKRRMKIH